ncbi:MAG TPA: Mur ligase domain-containing protein, partial [Candidatus Krumholzibacterium sp.]|nr:Mur ligase domain-containing protein [Candidatus Krumholzibacterium sp.]
MKLSGILSGVDMIERPEPDSVEITGLAVDSRRVSPGTLFIAVSGHAADGHDFIGEALKNGASAIVAERRIDAQVPVALVTDSRAAEPVIARNYF